MILSIVSFQYAEEINKVIEESNKPVLENMVVTGFDLLSYIKQQLDQLQQVSILIIDLSALENADEEIITAISNFRMLYETAKIIFIAPGRNKGDKLLSEIFCMGIYDIIPGDVNVENIADEVNYCISKGKTFRESLMFKEAYTIAETDSEQIKERIIIKKEIRTAVNKAFIGFTGTQPRIGVTHTAIVSANYLKDKGYKVALIEEKSNKNKCFEYIKNSFDTTGDEEYFNINQIDYYPDFDIKNIFKILTKNYNFVLIDFGLFNMEFIAEFNRCVIPIIITGSKPWEIDNINKIFECIPEDDLKEYSYIFNFTDESEHKSIIDGMGTLQKVFFSDYSPDPFNSRGSDWLNKLFEGYIPETVTQTKKSNNINPKEIIAKCKSIFLK